MVSRRRKNQRCDGRADRMHRLQPASNLHCCRLRLGRFPDEGVGDGQTKGIPRFTSTFTCLQSASNNDGDRCKLLRPGMAKATAAAAASKYVVVQCLRVLLLPPNRHRRSSALIRHCCRRRELWRQISTSLFTSSSTASAISSSPPNDNATNGKLSSTNDE